MDSNLPSELKDARDALIACPWHFEDKVDSDELDDLCHQYLED